MFFETFPVRMSRALPSDTDLRRPAGSGSLHPCTISYKHWSPNLKRSMLGFISFAINALTIFAKVALRAYVYLFVSSATCTVKQGPEQEQLDYNKSVNTDQV